MNIPRLVIGGTGSGVGKTSISLGLVHALSRRGLCVQTFKVGPDFLDPTYLAIASGRTCYNLDSWMCGREYVQNLFRRKSEGADVVVIEGAMGLFDGVSPATLEGSTAEIAQLAGAPIILVGNARGTARSFAAFVKGFDIFEKDVRISGAIANHCGSGRQTAWLTDSLQGAKLPPLLGGIPGRAFPELPSRHLGLITADRNNLSIAVLDSLADVIEKYVDVNAILGLANASPEISFPADCGKTGYAPCLADSPTIGVAFDDAFHFYYPDNLECLEEYGGKIVKFSPVSDKQLPDGMDALYFGGGYPEEHASTLSQNSGMLESIRRFAAGGGAIYAECGGLMYLSQGIKTVTGDFYPMTGILPFETRMCSRRKSLGYVEVSLNGNTMWGDGGSLRGHEFHYSEIVNPVQQADGWKPAYQVRYRRKSEAVDSGFQKGGIFAGYVHMHFGGHMEVVRAFFDFTTKGKR